MLTQIEEFKSFITQGTTYSGRGMSSLTDYRADRSTPICAMKADVAEFTEKYAWHKASKEINIPQVFVPSSGVRPLKRMNLEGTLVNKQVEERKGQCIQNCACRLGKVIRGSQIYFS